MTDARSSPPPRTRFGEPPRDPILDELVRLAHIPGVSIGVTLQFAGCIISGTLIGLDEYMTRYADDWDASLDATAETMPDVAEAFRRWSQEYRDGAKEFREHHDSGTTDHPSRDWEFVHLAGARYVFGRTMIPDSGMLWRGRLRDVQGFTRGMFGQLPGGG